MTYRGFAIKNVRSGHGFLDNGNPAGWLICSATNKTGDIILWAAHWAGSDEASVPGINHEFKNAVQRWYNEYRGENNKVMRAMQLG